MCDILSIFLRNLSLAPNSMPAGSKQGKREIFRTKLGGAQESLRQMRHNLSHPFTKIVEETTKDAKPPANSNTRSHFASSPDGRLVSICLPPQTPPPYWDNLNFSPAMDGAGEGPEPMAIQKLQNKMNVSAIFVHAGAGYHSTTNEHIHLGACNE